MSQSLGTSTARGVVLVVDDQVKNIQIVGTILTKEGYEVIPATSGLQALQRTAARLPDLVLLDVVMPEMDGFEVCRRLREHPDTAGLPVIFVSAANDSETIVRGLEAGGMDYITKPFNKAELLARVRTHVDLQRARETTARFLREKEQLVSMVAHDLKNPLSAIRLSAQVAHELPPEKAGRTTELLEHIVETCDRMLNFIDRFLSSRALEKESEAIIPTPLPLREIEEALKAWQAQAKKKGITLTLELPGREAEVMGDAMAVRQILDNLMSNAIKFSPPGTEVAVRLALEEKAVVVTIEDEGPGFTESDLAHLFEDYRRLTARPTGDEPSTGLGLAIAKRAADRMGTTLTIGNREGHAGSRSRFELPLLP
ncbi:MAG TPA: hybrid sensor histidine kinase/response regulator [Prosthecobacter sp.]|nr:hybrid sensor histidine kinase/response regulator [Prosthecobacter sp.]